MRVTAGAVIDQEVGLTPAAYQMDKFVIAADAFGNVADLNLGNFLLRLSGVSKEDSKRNLIRATNPASR